jgi:hypothetical protein
VCTSVQTQAPAVVVQVSARTQVVLVRGSVQVQAQTVLVRASWRAQVVLVRSSAQAQAVRVRALGRAQAGAWAMLPQPVRLSHVNL